MSDGERACIFSEAAGKEDGILQVLLEYGRNEGLVYHYKSAARVW